jgi:hypothetical protein
MEAKKSGNRLVEILHIDTEDSQGFFMNHHATDPEKCECQKALEETFTLCCRTFGGRVRSPIEGDGAIAYFDTAKFSGGSVRAAEKFLAELPKLHKQIERLLPNRKVSRQHFRIKAHFGSIYFDRSHKRQASRPEVIDSLVKNEKQIAPLADQLFITEELLTTLDSKLKTRFVPASRRRQFGKLTTVIHRLKNRPAAFLTPLPIGGKRKNDITPKELNFLKRSLTTQVRLMTARNIITNTLTKRMASQRRPLRSTDLVAATLEGMHSFLVSDYEDTTDKFNVTFWRPDSVVKPTRLQKQYSYPERGSSRKVSLRENKFQVVRSFIDCTAIFHEDVRASATNREWVYFDPQQAKRRNLCSAVQFPVYRQKKEVGERQEKEVLGVLSIDTNCPEFFHPEDASLWIDRVKGFLVNLALSQKL